MADDKYEAHRDDPPCHVGQRFGGSGGDEGWSVEARYAYAEPITIGAQTFDDRWRPVHFHDSKIGVPRGPRYSAPILGQCGLYEYGAAQALRWWFVATAQAIGQHLCLETRLVKHKVEYSYHYTAETVHEQIGGNDRSHLRPVQPVKVAAVA